MDYTPLCKEISHEVKKGLVKNLTKTGFIGDTLTNPAQLKSTHRIDETAIDASLNVLKNYPCNVYIESAQIIQSLDAQFAMFIDPVDGSLNWDRGVGDPCIAIAVSDKIQDIQLKDLNYAYVEGFRSGDVYYTQSGHSYFFSHLTQKEVIIHTVGQTCLSDATAYLRTGYSLAKNQLEYSFPLFLLCRDIRAIDNSAMEVCEIARNAADLMIEARQGSDNFNLLAYPILKNAGGLLCDLHGSSLDNLSMEFEQVVDFIVCNNRELLEQTLSVIHEMQKLRRYVQDNLTFSY